MTHPLVTQLRFARREFYRCTEGITAEDAMRRLESLNALSWTVGHLANHEHYLWVRLAQGQDIAPELHKLAGYGSPPSAPPWDEMLTLWGQISAAADRYLDTLTEQNMGQHLSWQAQLDGRTAGACPDLAPCPARREARSGSTGSDSMARSSSRARTRPSWRFETLLGRVIRNAWMLACGQVRSVAHTL